MKKHFVIYLFLVFGVSSTTAQNTKKIDSLLTVLKTAKEDTSKAMLFVFLADEYYQSDYEKAMEYSKQASSLAKKLNFIPAQANAANLMGNIISDNGKYADALAYYNQSYDLYEQIKDSVGMSYALNNIALTES